MTDDLTWPCSPPERFRAVILIALGLIFPLRSLADEAESSAGPAFQQTQIRVVTDDDFLNPSGPFWCSNSLNRSLAECQARSETREPRVTVLPAGAPEILEHVRPKVGPRRAICFFCDSNDRIFGLCIGVPRGAELVKLREDAEELMVIDSLMNQAAEKEAAQQLAQQPNEEEEEEEEEEEVNDRGAFQTLRERTALRTVRHYRPFLAQITPDLSSAQAAKILTNAAQSDLAERFQVRNLMDRSRLVSIQQHVEASRYWCEAMLPCILGRSFEEVALDLAAVIWSAEPWQIRGDEGSLTSWFDTEIALRPVVLQLEDSEVHYLSMEPTGPTQGTSDKKKLENLQSRQAEISQALFDADISRRLVNFAELACLVDYQAQHRNAKANKIFNDRDAEPKWLVFESKTALPIAIPASSHSRMKEWIKRETKQP